MVREAQGQEPTPSEAPFGACVHAPDALVQVPLVQARFGTCVHAPDALVQEQLEQAQEERGQIRLTTPLQESAERTKW